VAEDNDTNLTKEMKEKARYDDSEFSFLLELALILDSS